ncbi:response regulator [Ferrimonas sp. SCSIO 43195]|uniref:response regulator n=1 Tax=Ferrimonas sp. SCSIO 43195 TaxID=2822844 RepID=UPI002074DB66|nr:response regulator [Ferrimonas sp. SCSIO 43195]USD36483.1 response regulator [Ferrimonas sp. SCSIO 43195]
MLTDRTFLIIDHSTDFIGLVRSILLDAGASHPNITSTSDTLKALRLVRQHQYDAVLCGFDPERRVDGGLILDELRHHQHLCGNGAFLFISDDHSRETISQCLAMEPDDLLLKPFRYQELERRLMLALQRRQQLSELHQALADQAYGAALHLTLRLRRTFPQHTPFLDRTHGNCLLQLRRFSEALTFYRHHSQRSDKVWPRIGAGQALIGLQRFEDATHIFNELQRRGPFEPAAQQGLTQSALHQDACSDALSAMTRLQRLCPADPGYQVIIADLHAQQGDFCAAAHHYDDYLARVKGSHRFSPELQIHANLCRLFAALAETSPARRHSLIAQSLKQIAQLSQGSVCQPGLESGLKVAAALAALVEGQLDHCVMIMQVLGPDTHPHPNFYTQLNSAKLFALCGLTERFEQGIELARVTAEAQPDPTLRLSQLALLAAYRQNMQARLTQGARLADVALGHHKAQRYHLAYERACRAFFLVPMYPSLSLMLLEQASAAPPPWMDSVTARQMLDAAHWLYRSRHNEPALRERAAVLYQRAIAHLAEPPQPNHYQDSAARLA